MEADMAELATLDRLTKERNHIRLLIALLEEGDVKKALEILRADEQGINDAIAAK